MINKGSSESHGVDVVQVIPYTRVTRTPQGEDSLLGAADVNLYFAILSELHCFCVMLVAYKCNQSAIDVWS